MSFPALSAIFKRLLCIGINDVFPHNIDALWSVDSDNFEIWDSIKLQHSFVQISLLRLFPFTGGREDDEHEGERRPLSTKDLT